jgi:hypothetical protein
MTCDYGDQYTPSPLPGSSQIGVDFRVVIPDHPRLAYTSAISPQLA